MFRDCRCWYILVSEDQQRILSEYPAAPAEYDVHAYQGSRF